MTEPEKNEPPAVNRKYGEESAAVQAHVNLLQTVIQRMAANSNSCKAFCVTLVSAVLVVVADKGKPSLAALALLPALLFLVLDTYYLALERRFREAYNAFIKKMHEGSLAADDLFSVHPTGRAAATFFAAMGSLSVWLFYAVHVVLIGLAWLLVL